MRSQGVDGYRHLIEHRLEPSIVELGGARDLESVEFDLLLDALEPGFLV